MNSQLEPLINRHRSRLHDLCLLYGVEQLELFGSGVRGDFDPLNSDLDFIVRMKDPRQAGIARRFCGFADALEDLFGRPVDLLTEAMIRNPLFQSEVEQSRIVLVGPCDAS